MRERVRNSLYRRLLWIAAALLLGSACVDDPGQGTESATEKTTDPVMQKTPVAPGEFAVVRRVDGQWQFQLIGDKGQIYLTSEAYVEKPSALNGILSVEENGVLLERYVVTPTADGMFQLALRAANNQVIGDGPTLRTQDEADAAVQATRDLIAGYVQWKAAVTKGARFDLWREPGDSRWYFVLRAEDGGVLVESQSYQGRTSAVNGIESVRLNGKDPARYSVIDSGGAFHFIIKAGNGQEIGRSPAHATQADAEAASTATNELLISERVANPW